MVVTNSLGLSSLPLPVFSYKGPQITGVSPAYSFNIAPELDGSGPLIDFNVSGVGFGHSPHAVTRLSVGGEVCPSVEWVSSSLLKCLGIRMT